MAQKFRTRSLARVALAWVLSIAASATALAQPTVQGTIPIGDPNDPNALPGAPRNEPRNVAISTFGGVAKAWVADFGNGGVDIFDLSVVPASRLAFIPAPAGMSHAVAVDVKDDRAAVTYYSPANGSKIVVYNVATHAATVIDVGAPGSGSMLEGVAVVDTNYLVVTDRTRNLVQSWQYQGPGGVMLISSVSTVTNPLAQDPNNPNSLGPGFEPTDVEIVTRGANRFAIVVVNGSDRIEVYAVRSSTGSLGTRPVRMFSTQGKRPSHIAIETSRRQIYVTNTASDTVFVIGGAAGTAGLLLTSSLNGPAGVSVSVDTSGVAHLYVANRNSRQVAYYSGLTTAVPAFVGTVNVSRAPYGLASRFGLPIGVPPNPPGFGDRIILTSLGDDAIDDIGR
jgi:hypothetical protein